MWCVLSLTAVFEPIAVAVLIVAVNLGTSSFAHNQLTTLPRRQ